MTEIKGYHAHVYYNADTRKIAEGLRATIIEKFAVKPGAFSDEPIGPHPISQFNVIFQTEEFQKIVPWLMLNHETLDVLIHPLTESSYDDHSKNALWIGTPVPMRLEFCGRPIAPSCCQPTPRPNIGCRHYAVFRPARGGRQRMHQLAQPPADLVIAATQPRRL